MEQIALRDISGHSHECTLSFSGDLPLQLQLQLQLQPQVQLRLQLDAEQLRQELSQWATGAKVSVQQHLRLHQLSSYCCVCPGSQTCAAINRSQLYGDEAVVRGE